MGHEAAGESKSMTSHAFIDESVRGRNYCLCATLVPGHGLAAARSHMRSLLISDQRRLHFASESPRRRKALLQDIAKIPCQSTIHVAVGGEQVEARAAALESLIFELIDRSVERIVLDARQGQDHRDRVVIARALGPDTARDVQYQHLSSASEPLLWIPDAVAWSWGRGGPWRSSIEELGLLKGVQHTRL